MKLMLRSSGARVAVAAAGLAFLLTFEFLRSWAVTMPLFYQGSLRLSVPLLALIAFSPFLAAFVAVPALRRGRPPVLPLALGVAGARMALQFMGPGLPRLIMVLAGLAASLVLLVAIAPRRETVLALVGALAADAALLMALQTESLVFRNGAGAAAGSAVMCATLVGAFCLQRTGRAGRDGRAAAAQPPPRDSLLPWLGFGPALALHLTVASLPAPIEVATGWGAGTARIVVAGTYMVGAALAFWLLARAPKGRWARVVPVVAGVASAGAAFLALFAGATYWAVVAGVLLPAGLLVGLSSLARVSGPSPATGIRAAAVVAVTLGVTVPLVYYMGFIFRYPIAPSWLLAATACIFTGLLALLGLFDRPVDQLSALRAAKGISSVPEGSMAAAPSSVFAATRFRRARLPVRVVLSLAAVLVVFLLAAPAVGSIRHADRSALNGFPVRIASYNIFMGLGADVNMDLDRLAREIEAQKPDVIALQEVSRGWFTSGSVDLLPRLAERLGYAYRFFPAADHTWGNAILSRLPAADSAHGFLPQGISAMRRGWGGAILELGNGQRLFFVVTHLYHPAEGSALRAKQAEELVLRTVGVAERYHLVDMTVVVGDLNAEWDSPELTPIRDTYMDLLGPLGSLPTYPSWAPDQRIDHVFASAGLKGSDSVTFGGLASDHLGVAVTLRLTGDPDRSEAAPLN